MLNNKYYNQQIMDEFPRKKEAEPHSPQVIAIRHTRKGKDNNLAPVGIAETKALKNQLPQFDQVYSSPSPRTQETGRLLTGVNPEIDKAFSFPRASKDLSDIINQLADANGVEFVIKMLQIFNNPEKELGKELAQQLQKDIAEFRDQIIAQVKAFNQRIDQIHADLAPEQRALVISHDIILSPARQLRLDPTLEDGGEFQVAGVDPLSGYSISDPETGSLAHEGHIQDLVL